MISISCCYKWSCINHSIRYVNFDHCWMSSPGLSSESHLFSYFVPDKSYHSIYHHVPYSVSYFFTDGDNQCIQPLSFKSAFSATYSSKKNIFYCQLWNESLTVLWAEWEPGVSDRGCLCCQSKAEQWLRLISILMNANWHICYGGLAVQTLQLAWLINYPPAGGSLEMEAGEGMGVGREMKQHEKRKRTDNCPKPALGFFIWLD